MRTISIEPLTSPAFRPYGDVIETGNILARQINQGFAERVDGLAFIDVISGNGHVNISLFSARKRPSPMAVKTMERHPLGSQLFFPLQESTWLVLVCDDPRDLDSYRAFRASGRQGVNYAKGTWHHPLLVLANNERFIVVDRIGPGANLEETQLGQELFLPIPQMSI